MFLLRNTLPLFIETGNRITGVAGAVIYRRSSQNSTKFVVCNASMERTSNNNIEYLLK